MTNQDSIVIVGAKRTAMGGLQGAFSNIPSPELGAVAIKAACEQAGVSPDSIDEVIMGCVLSAGLGQAPARQAALKAGLAQSTPCTTINKMCGSGMKAIMQGMDALKASSSEVVVAGGQENMTQAPYLVAKGRSGYRLGHDKLYDHMFLDGLEDAYDKGKLMGVFAEATAQKYQFSREAQDEFALRSLERAQKAIDSGAFADEIAPVVQTTRKGEITIDTDEQPGNARPDKIPQLKPAFAKDGTVTAANSSSISDGAAACVLMRESKAKALGLTPLARIIGTTSYAHEPAWFTTAPVGAMRKLFEQTGWQPSEVDLYEINEAFAVVTMAGLQDLELDAEKVNVHGGACALGHPIGASGARIVVTLINALKQRNLSKGVASLCIGGGEATALALEIV